MTSDNNNEIYEEDQPPSELDMLKQRADLMGIAYHPNIGVVKLKAKIDDQLEGPSEGHEDLSSDDINTMATSLGSQPTVETPAAIRARMQKQALQLVRVRVACMNPLKGNLKGDLFSVGNAQIGFTKKFVPFNTEQGWHVPAILLRQIQSKKYMTHYETKIGNKKIKKHRLVPEYSVEILPPLTAKELKDLAQRQTMANK